MSALQMLANAFRFRSRKPSNGVQSNEGNRTNIGEETSVSGVEGDELRPPLDRVPSWFRFVRSKLGRASSVKSPGRRVSWHRRAGALFVIGIAIVAGYASFGLREIDPSKLSRIPRIDSTPGGERQAESQHYRQTLMDANSINAEAAVRTGSSYISIPEGLPTNIIPDGFGFENGPADVVVASEPQPDPVAAANSVPTGSSLASIRASGEIGDRESSDQPDETRLAGRTRTTNVTAEAMISQMGAIARGLAIGTPDSVVLIVDSDGATGEGASLLSPAVPGGFANEAGNPVRAKGGSVLIPAGTILYGEIVTTVSSDLSSPVVAEITAGKLAGSRLVGGFASVNAARALAVTFNKLATSDGTEIGIEAVAVDGFDSRPLIASEVNSRLVGRFGPGLVASLISGFAESASRPPISLGGVGDGVVASTGRSTTRESVIAGIGRAADRLGADLEAGAPSGAEIILRAGHPVGVLFLSTIELPI
ncbi:MAG: DotG/IcmE/VirB10 family protein [Rhodobacteraceae bacterium]|nr:DotG/IcmE/VirB10 family protein [Paracoccaceae bacterium]